MSFPVNIINPIKRHHLWENFVQEPYIKQMLKTDRWHRRQDDLIQLISNTLLRYNADSVYIVFNGLNSYIINFKIELGSKTYGAHHAQGVIAKRFNRIERCAYEFVLQIGNAIEWVYQLAISIR